MAVASTGKATELAMSKKWSKERETSPERTKVWTEPPTKLKTERKVPVVYYLSRNGQLEHPHFMEVALSSSQGLYLTDVIERLNFLRGKGMASMYSWSSKRSYKNGFVWHDLAENDFIYPAHGQEYVLKGSELLDGAAQICKSNDPLSSSFRKPPPETRKTGEESDFPVVTRRRNQSWSAIDLHEYKVYAGEASGRAAADASTQTDDKRRRRRAIREIEEEEIEENRKEDTCQNNQSTELSREEISPPPSDSSPETLESLMKADGRVVVVCSNDDRTAENHQSGRLKASTVLMQLISCGSISFKDCGPAAHGKDHRGFSLISHYYKSRLPRGGGGNRVGKDAEEGMVENIRRINNAEDKEYFSGSLIETKKEEFPALKRSSSYNADRTSRLELLEQEIEGVRAKCIPRKPNKTHSTRKECNVNEISCSSSSSNTSAVNSASK